ncbi:MAG: hypothetical protein ABWY13_02160 [Mesorhizobium sp.]|jgi:hypothetical protein
MRQKLLRTIELVSRILAPLLRRPLASWRRIPFVDSRMPFQGSFVAMRPALWRFGNIGWNLGLPPACVDAYIAEVSKAPPPALVQVVRAILDSDDWPEAVKVFGTGNPDPNEWGFGFSTTADLNRSASAFATISRQAGIMPSVYLMASMVLLLQKIGGELAPK